MREVSRAIAQPLPVPLGPTARFLRRAWRWLQLNLIVIGAYLALLGVWQLADLLFHVPRFLLPSPWEIIRRIAERPDKLAFHLAVTLQEVLIGFLIAVVVSIPSGILIVYSRVLERLIYPFLVAFQAIPKVALAPILVVWFGFGLTSKISLALVTAMFPIVLNTVVGMNQTPPEMIHLMRSLGASWLQIFLKVRLLAAAPHIFGGFKIGITLAVVGAVVGEFIASNSGLGYFLLVANNGFDTPLLFGIVVILSFVSIALFYVVELIEVLVLPGPLRKRTAAGAMRLT
ncbi:MAG TPA: ABC transporter permease, partial [Myxococcaceae bacterium]|nr:ABC transporter permease [Myxococcaceae bacterium]